MLVDGFTIAAQVMNFLILVILLKKFLYGPVIRAMEERENRIKKAVEKAETERKKAEEQAQALALEQEAFHEKKTGLMNEAKAEIARWREEKIDDLKLEMSLLKNTWAEKIDRERQTFILKLKQDAVRHIMDISEKVMRDLAGRDLEERVIAVFLEKNEHKEHGFKDPHYTGFLRVVSGFELSGSGAENIEKKLRQWFPSAKEAHFEVSRKLGLGIEILAGDKKTAWNLEKYLGDLEKEILPDRSLKDTDRR